LIRTQREREKEVNLANQRGETESNKPNLIVNFRQSSKEHAK